MKLHYDPCTVNCRKVIAGLKLMEIDFESETYDYFDGLTGPSETGFRTLPAYLAINPMAELPTLTDGDLNLWESNAILQYAADAAGPSSAYPQDLKVRADINRWLLWESNKWFASCYVYLVENVVKPYVLKVDPDAAILEGEDGNFHKLAGILNARLAGQSWISGNSPSIADIVVAAPMHLHSYQKLPLSQHGNVQAWYERLEELPCWSSTDVAPLLGLS
mgnify:FL=1